MVQWQRIHDVVLGLFGLTLSSFSLPLIGKLFYMTNDIMVALVGIPLVAMLILSLCLLELTRSTR